MNDVNGEPEQGRLRKHLADQINDCGSMTKWALSLLLAIFNGHPYMDGDKSTIAAIKAITDPAERTVAPLLYPILRLSVLNTAQDMLKLKNRCG